MCIIIIIGFLVSKTLYKNSKFNILLNLLTALTFVFTSYAIIVQINTLDATQTDAQIQFYQNIYSKLIDNTMTTFSSQKNMTYFYDDIFHPLNYTRKSSSEYKRNYSAEQQITYEIIQDIADVLYFINSYGGRMSEYQSHEVMVKLKIFTDSLTQSEIFVENYKNVDPYSIMVRNYFKTKYNM
jgi:gamma-glutamyl phosphate reductase